MRWLVLSALIVSCLAGALDDAFSNDAGFESIDKTGSESKRAIDDNAAGNKEEKFNIYVGTIDGVRRIIFNEVDGGDKEGMGQPDHGEPFDRFGAYDDNNVIAQENEKSIFVPRPYRPTPKTTEPPTTTSTTTTTTRPPTTRRPLPTQPPQPPRIVTPQTPARVPFEPVTRPTFQQPPRQQPIAPFAPQTVQPQQPNRQPFHPQPLPQQPFRPQQPQQQQFHNNNNFQQQQFRTRRPPFQPATAAPVPFTQAPRQPAFTQPPPSVDTQGGLRSGVCHSSIFYISTPITGPTRLSFTHFAIAVTVDQCARTCHEFNCAIAHYNPINGHCEFNPSTAFAIRNGQCPAWPSLHYRNNVVASEPVRIFCATCQRPRRRNNGGASTTGRRVGFNRQFDARGRASQQGIFRGSRFPRERPSAVIHGTLLRQPQAISLSQSSFLGLVSAEQAQQSSIGGESRARARGAATQLVSSPISIEVGEDQDDIPVVRRIDSREN